LGACATAGHGAYHRRESRSPPSGPFEILSAAVYLPPSLSLTNVNFCSQSTRVEALREAAAATHLKLTEEELKSISEPYKPRGILGHA